MKFSGKIRFVKVALHAGVLIALAAGMAAVGQKSPTACQVADAALARGELDTARSQYEACLKQSTPTFETLSNIGILYARLGQFNLAIQAYRQALALNPENPQVHMNLGLAFLKTDHYDEAASEFARALLANPDNPQVEELLAFCHYQLKQYELAALEAARVRKAKPDEPSAAFLLGSAYLKLQLYDQAIPLIDFALRRTGSAESHAILGEAYLGVRAFAPALEEFSKALQLRPRMPGVHAKMGTAYSGLANTDLAIGEFGKELEQNPNDFEANYSLGRLKRLQGDLPAAQKYLEKARQLRPDDPALVFEYAVLAVQDKNYPKALELLDQVLQKHPSFIDAHVLISEVYFRANRREEAEREKATVEALKKAQQSRQRAPGKTGPAYGGNAALDPRKP